ncbi:MAG: hypothetical protein WCB04_10755 [Mycobacteriales bacterium]
MVKKILGWLAIAFAVFYLLSSPVEAAAAIKAVGDGLVHAADQLAKFFSSLAP